MLSATHQQTTTPVQQGKWLIFADSEGIGQLLTDAITGEQGKRGKQGKGQVVTVFPGYSYQAMGANRYRINPASADDMRRVLKAVSGDENGEGDKNATLHGVIHLWSLDMTPTERMNIASLEADQVLGVGSALNLIQTLLTTQQGEQGRLWFVTRGAQAIQDTESLQVTQSPLWGLGRTCAIEHPALWGGMIDLDPNVDASTSASQLFTLLSQQSNEDQIAIRQSQSYVARMVRSNEWTPTPLKIERDATYLITGGLWGLGLEVAHWLTRKGARHLVLLGRSALPARAQWDTLQQGSRQTIQIAGLRVLERAGVHVHYAPVDVANEAQMNALLENLPRQGFPAIRGIIHAASVWQDAQGQSLVHPLINLEPSSLQEVFRPKVEGAWLLHSLFADRLLDFFVSFSSGASLFGSAAQSNYAAAGAFLDALAHYRRAKGQVALSINWGAVSETGFGATSEGQKVHEYWESHGIGRITPRHVLAALELLIPQKAAQVGVLKLDWQQLQEFFPQLTQLPLVTHLVDSNASTQASSMTATTTDKSSTLQSLLSVESSERQERLEAYLSEQVAGVLRVPESRLDREQPLTALGLDSLMAIELKNRIERELTVHISIVAFLQGPSIRQFTAQLLEQLPQGTQLTQAARSPQAAEVAQMKTSLEEIGDVAIDQLSDDEVNALLSTMLHQDGQDGQDRQDGQHSKVVNGTQQDKSISPQSATQLLAQLDQLSDDEVESLLSQITQEGDR